MSESSNLANPLIEPDSGQEFMDMMDSIIQQITDETDTPTNTNLSEIPGMPAPKELPPNYIMKNYRLIKPLGEGGFGVTYLAEDVLLNRLVVLKESFPHTLCERQAGTLDVVPQMGAQAEECENAMINFLREVRLLAKLDHPNIVKIYTFFERHKTAYYVTEYIDGMCLADVVSDYRKHLGYLPQDDLYSLMVRVLDALDYLHSRDILHLDIKPDNILVTRDGRPIIIDMGAARERHADACNGVVESVGFSPPEQCASQLSDLGPWTDLYGFAATLYYLLTKTAPPAGAQRSLYDTLDPLASIPKLTAIYHPQLLASIDKALSPNIEHRYKNVSEWMEDLRPR